MMELATCALVVILVGLVTATPYGYGVKGGAGAAARAESLAAAGAFGGRGDIPASIPFGTGFTGSFSKSSSNSASSSSASSSSSSFSYGNSGAISGQGCSTGGCQNAGANEISANHGANVASAGLHGYNFGNPASVAGSGAISGANCQGLACDNSVEKCTSGQCQPKLQTGTLPTSYDADNKCASGQCGSASPYGPSASSYDDSDDIRFVAHSSKSAPNSKDQSSSYDKTLGYNTGSGCQGGSCGPSTNFNARPNYNHGIANYYSNTKPLTNSNPEPTPSYHQPATELEAPKEDINCNSGNCNGQHGVSSTSYNVPSSTQKPTCHEGKCEKPLKGSHSSIASNPLSTNYLRPQGSQIGEGPSYGYSTSPNCADPNCGLTPGSQISGTPSVTGSTDVHHGATSPSCSSPNCNSYHTGSASSGSNTQPGQISPSGPANNDKPSTINKSPSHVHPGLPLNQPTFGNTPTGCNAPNCFSQSSTPVTQLNSGSHLPSGDINTPGQKQLPYTGGFGGPPGMLKPNEFNIPAASTSKPQHSASPTYSTPITSPTGCTTPNCIGYSTTAGVTSVASAQSGSFGIHKPQIGGVTIAGDKLPTYTGGFGGPAGMLKPNEFSIQATNKPIHSVNLPYNSQSPTPSTTTGCKTPNCNTYPSGAGVTTAVDAQSGYGATKPSTSVDSPNELPLYTGGFGGPSGLLKPNEFHHAPSVSQNPNYSSLQPGCTTANCSPSSAGTTIETHPQTSFGVTKPSITSPGYTSNYNRPIGVTKPSAPAVAPISSSYSNAQPTHPTGTYSTVCNTGNCADYSTNSVPTAGPTPTESFGVAHIKPQYTGGFERPGSVTPSDNSYNIPVTGSGSPNCKNTNCASVTTFSTEETAPSSPTAGSNQQLPGYPSGFGSPSSLLKPNGYSNPSVTAKPDSHQPSTGPSSPACSSGSCKVTSPSSPGYSVGSAEAHTSASSAASADAVVYTGGFGGPSGILTPYDDGKVDLTKIANGLNQGSHYNDGNIHSPHETKPATAGQLGFLSNTGALFGSAAGATAYSGSLAGANIAPGSYNTHGTLQAAHSIQGGSPCGGRCGGEYPSGLNGSGSAAAARSLSSTGAFGTAGSFASSSATAHSSAGAYTKGGYGKR